MPEEIKEILEETAGSAAPETPAGEEAVRAEKPAEAKTPGSEKAAEPRKPNPVQPRIDQLTREKAELRRDKETLERENQELRKMFPQGKEAEFSEPKPKREDFLEKEDPEEAYLDARDDWNRKRNKWEQTTEEVKNSTQMAAEDRRALIDQKTAEAAEKHGEEFIRYAQSPELGKLLTEELREAVLDSPHFAEVAIAMGKNLDLTRNLALLSGKALNRAIGVIEAKTLSQSAKPAEKGAIKAPFEPPRLPSQGASISGEIDLESVPMDEFARIRDRQQVRGG